MKKFQTRVAMQLVDHLPTVQMLGWLLLAAAIVMWAAPASAAGGSTVAKLAITTAQSLQAPAAKGHSRPLFRSGKLQGSFKSRVFANRVTIDSADPKAQFHEFGTTAHTIRPRSARWLRFKTTSGVAWAKHVRHPGNPARPMLPDENTARSLAMDVIGNLVRAATGK